MYDSFDLDCSFSFSTTKGQLLNVKLKAIELDRLDKFVKSCRMTFIVSALIYKNMESQKLFGLDGELGEDFVPEGLEDGKEVEIEAGLKRELVVPLLQEAAHFSSNKEIASAGLVTRYLLESSQQLAETPFLIAENWYALAIKQEIPIPEDLQENSEGTLKMGSITEWGERFAEEEEMEDTDEQEEGEIFPVMMGFFEEEGIEYHADEEDEFILLSIPGEPGIWNCICEALEKERLCRIYSIFPIPVLEEQYTQISELLARINAEISLGNFEIDYETEYIRFRTSLSVRGDRFSKALMKQLFMSNIFTMEEYYDRFVSILLEETILEETMEYATISN